MLKKISISFLFVFILASCDTKTYTPYVPDYSKVPTAFPRDEAKKVTKENGLIIYEVEIGTGNQIVNNRDAISGYYTGRLTNGEVFDSSYRDGATSSTTLNLGGINSQTGGFTFIDGFRQGFVGMKPGGKRVIVIPPALGYGNLPSSQFVKDTLIFDVEVEYILTPKISAEN